MKKFIIFMMFIFILSACSLELDDDEVVVYSENSIINKYYETSEVISGDIKTLNTYIGYIDSYENISIGAKISGKITSTSREVGDRVSMDDIVATIDSQSPTTKNSSSKEIIDSLEILKQNISSSYDAQENIIRENIKQAQNNLEISIIGNSGVDTKKIDLENSIQKNIDTLNAQIKSANTQIESVILTLENEEKSLDQTQKDLYINSKNIISIADTYIANLIDFGDSLYNITNKYKGVNSRFYGSFGGKDSNQKNLSKNLVESFIYSVDDLVSLEQDTNEEIVYKLNSYIEFFENDTRNVLDQIFITLLSSIDSNNFSTQEINELKSRVLDFKSQNEQILLNISGGLTTGLKGSIDNINSFEKNKQKQIDALEKQIELSYDNLDALLAQKNQVIANLDSQLNMIEVEQSTSKKQIDLAQNIIDELNTNIEALQVEKRSKLSEIDSQISEIKAQQSEINLMIEYTNVKADFDGIITQKLAHSGDIVQAGMPIYKASNDKKLKLNINIPNNVLDSINIGDKLLVLMDGVDMDIYGEVSKILPKKDEITNNNQIEISLPGDKNIKLGSKAKISIETKLKGEKILVPNNAIIQKYGISQVFVLKDNAARLTYIEIIGQDSQYSEILGLDIGDRVITNGKEKILDGEILFNIE